MGGSRARSFARDGRARLASGTESVAVGGPAAAGLAFQPPSDFGVNFDRADGWGSTISTASWARLRAQGVGFVRMTHYAWNPEIQAIRDQMETIINGWDWNIMRVRRSATTTRILFERYRGLDDIPVGRTVQLSHDVTFGTLTVPARTDQVANQSAAQTAGSKARFWSVDTGDVQPDETQWGGTLMNRLDGSTTTLRCTMPQGPGTFTDGQVIQFAIPLVYDTFTLPARTNITMRTSGAVAGEANIVATNTFDLILSAPVADLGDVRAQLGLLDKSIYRQDNVTVRHPISTMVGIVNNVIAAGLGFWWAGNHSSLEYAVSRYGAATVLAMERLVHEYLAAQAFPASLFAIADQEEPIHILGYGFTTNPTQIEEQWDEYRTTLLEPSLASMREVFPSHTLIYGPHRYRGLRSAVEAFGKIGADSNVIGDVHVFPDAVDTYSRSFDDLGLAEYENTFANIEDIRTRTGVEVAVGEHGFINLEATFKADRYARMLQNTRGGPNRTLVGAWNLGSIDDGSGAGKSVGRWSGSPREVFLNEEIEEVVRGLPRTTIALAAPTGSSFTEAVPIVVSGSFTGAASTIEYRVYDSGVALGSWATLDAAPGASTFAGTITPALGTDLTVRVRKAGVPSFTVESGSFDVVVASAPTIGTAKFLFYSYPEVSIFPQPAGLEWLAQWDFRNPITYGGTLPADGANVTAAQCIGGFAFAAQQDGAANVPTFALNGLGTGRHSLRFAAASSQYLLLPGLHSMFSVTDAAPVLLTVARHRGSGSPQMFVSFNKGDITADFAQLYVSGGTNNYRANGKLTTAVAAQITLALDTTNTMAQVSHHGRATVGNRVNKLLHFRNGGSLLTHTAASGEALTYTGANALTHASIGARRASNVWGNFADMDLLMVGVGRLATGTDVLSGAAETALMDFAKREGGIA